MCTCHVCGKPTPNYHEWRPSIAAILGELGESGRPLLVAR